MSLCEKGCNKLLLTLESRALICMVPHWNGIQGHTLTSQSTTIIFVSSLSCHKALYGGCWTCSLFETGYKIILWNLNPLLYSYPFTFMSQSFVWRLLDVVGHVPCLKRDTMSCCENYILIVSLSCHTFTWVFLDLFPVWNGIHGHSLKCCWSPGARTRFSRVWGLATPSTPTRPSCTLMRTSWYRPPRRRRARSGRSFSRALQHARVREQSVVPARPK